MRQPARLFARQVLFLLQLACVVAVAARNGLSVLHRAADPEQAGLRSHQMLLVLTVASVSSTCLSVRPSP